MRGTRNRLTKIGSQIVNREVFVLCMFVILTTFICGMYESNADALTNSENTVSVVSVSDGDSWYYFKGMQKPPKGWNNMGFDYSNWQKGLSGIGYGLGTNRTDLADMQGNYSTVYARYEFNINSPASITGMTTSVICDGPFIVFVNGVEVIRTNTIQAPRTHQSENVIQAEQFNINGFVHELLPGKNVLAIECSNDDLNSSDFSMIPLFEVLANEEVQQ